jgi:hypothetical protein
MQDLFGQRGFQQAHSRLHDLKRSGELLGRYLCLLT